MVKNKACLSDLVLWRNDSTATARIYEAATEGELDAQYALGLCYAEGRGITQDLIQAYVWLSLAIEQGDRDAFDLRAIVVEQMTDEQFQAAKQSLADQLTKLRD